MINKSWCKIAAADLVIFSIFPWNIPLDFYESIRIVPLKYLMYFLVAVYPK